MWITPCSSTTLPPAPRVRAERNLAEQFWFGVGLGALMWLALVVLVAAT